MSHPANNNYNDAALVIDVDPVELNRVATVDIKAQATVITDSLSRIGNIWDGLELTWGGDTAAHAQAFAHEWDASFSRLLGTRENPDSGAITRLWNAVSQAAGTYGEAERVIIVMFRDLADALAAPDTSGGRRGSPFANTGGSIGNHSPHSEH